MPPVEALFPFFTRAELWRGRRDRWVDPRFSYGGMSHYHERCTGQLDVSPLLLRQANNLVLACRQFIITYISSPSENPRVSPKSFMWGLIRALLFDARQYKQVYSYFHISPTISQFVHTFSVHVNAQLWRSDVRFESSWYPFFLLANPCMALGKGVNANKNAKCSWAILSWTALLLGKSMDPEWVAVWCLSLWPIIIRTWI